MNRISLLALALIASLSLGAVAIRNREANYPAFSNNQEGINRISDFDSAIKAAIENCHIPGMQIGLIVDGKVVLSRGYGYRNLAEKAPMTEDTTAGIGSLSKAFATYILRQLVQEGKISWDDPVIKYLPEFRLFDPDSTQKMTILDLAAHRTGIFRHDGLWYLSDRSKLPPSEGLKLLPFLEPSNKPREKFQYNNFMYSVLGLIIERITETTYEEAVSSRVLKPLGMLRSGFSHGTSNYALPYAHIEGEIREIPFQETPVIAVGGGIYSTVSDMLKWVDLHLKKGNLMREMYTVQMPFTPVSGESIRNLGYGLGWFVGEYRGYEHVYHMGLVDGFAAHLALLPQKNIGLVILTNSSSDGLAAIAYLQQLVFDKLLGLNENNPLPENKPLLTKQQDLEITPSQSLQNYVGDYTHPAYGPLQTRILDGRLTLLYSEKTIFLTPSGNNLFRAKADELQKFGISPWIEISFSMNSEGKISEIQFPFEAFRSGKPIVFTKK